jgi:hypothetical protein
MVLSPATLASSAVRPLTKTKSYLTLNLEEELPRFSFWQQVRLNVFSHRLARFPVGRNRPNDKKSRQINKLERILVAKVCQLLRNSL